MSRTRVRAVALATILAALCAAVSHADDPCDEILRAMIRDLDDEVPAAATDRALVTIGEFERTYGRDSVASIARATRLEAADDVGAGKSTTRILGTQWQSLEGKRVTFRDIQALSNSGVPGPDGLLKKAGEQAARANPGGVFEIQASAAIHRDPGTWGPLERVFVDNGGPGALNKIDTMTETHVFQMKSKYEPDDVVTFGLDGDVKPADLDQLASQAGGRGPVLAVSRPNPVSTELRDACASREIEIVFFDLVR